MTAETGVLEAPAGAVRQGNTLHVFHQFRPTPESGARWAHQVATDLPYGWDVCDDVLAPLSDEIDCLAGSSVAVGDGVVELFFVVTTPAMDTTDATDADHRSLLGSRVPHDRRGSRDFRIHRARISDLDLISEDISDDPSVVRQEVERLGQVTVDDRLRPVTALVTPSVVRDGDRWLMIALDLVDDTAATIVVLTSEDRQHWTVQGALEIYGDPGIPAGRPFAPRITRMTDEFTDDRRDVLFITYPTSPTDASGGETAGYLVGTLDGTRFTVESGFRVFDHGHDFTRPRVVHGPQPVILGLVGTFPGPKAGTWANCLSVPRFLSLRDGHLYQDIVGVPSAVRSYTDRGAVFTAQLDVSRGAVTVSVIDDTDRVLATVRHSGDRVEVDRPRADGTSDLRTATLADGDSDTLTVVVDGPVCEVFADGGLVSLTSALSGSTGFARFQVDTSGGARVLSAMESLGRRLQRRLARLDSPEEQERLIAEAALAERDLAAGIDPADIPDDPR
ncbi:sucrose-6-phosphate hydrolase [Corynebacterium terpenotabidum Y-11]|uniref:beta-fructofuranosidase n=1 Tax=Corynebacterium terpenotabidum Y-11 TaxID=1200352 RepID=S4XDD4_9CORY|nr:sucrose-6-phosphate hydrolase [Corynebacterium terpenotabidum Y-11]